MRFLWQLNGFIYQEDTKYQIYQALGLEKINLHSITYERLENGRGEERVLSIVFKLKKPLLSKVLNK
jgi:hypothetical protein